MITDLINLVKGVGSILGVNSIEEVKDKLLSDDVTAEQKIQLEQIYNQDKSNARDRQVKIAQSGKSDWLMSFVAISTVVLLIMAVGADAFSDKITHDILYMLIGALATKFGSLVDYFFGSSRGSSEKNKWWNKDAA